MLTPALTQALIGIYRFSLKYSVTPSVRELALFMGKGQGTMQDARNRLKKQGFIDWRPNKGRTTVITEKGLVYLSSIGEYRSPRDDMGNGNHIPCLGEIAAGYLSQPAMQEEWIEIGHFNANENFVLRVSGDSMIEAGIHDRAIAIFQRVPDNYEPKPGEIVAAYVEGFGTTLKRFYREGWKVILEAANPQYPPQAFDIRQTFIRIHGVWTGFIYFPKS
jgi:repressor LexA